MTSTIKIVHTPHTIQNIQLDAMKYSLQDSMSRHKYGKAVDLSNCCKVPTPPVQTENVDDKDLYFEVDNQICNSKSKI